MSQAKNKYQASRWLATSKDDLEAGRILMDAGKTAQACFFFQQAGEKAVKALWYFLDLDPWGHSVKKLISGLPESEDLLPVRSCADKAALLDKYYIPTRYPNGLPDLTPGEVYTFEDAERGLEAATLIICACETAISSE
jgi:HEPN domain-containing protein